MLDESVHLADYKGKWLVLFVLNSSFQRPAACVLSAREKMRLRVRFMTAAAVKM